MHQGWWGFESNPSGTLASNFKRPMSAIAIPNGSGVRVVTSAQLVSSSAQCVMTSDTGGETWTARSGHFGTSTNGYRDMVWTGTHIIGIPEVSSSTVGRSSDGATWSSVSTGASATRLKLASNGNGTVVAFRANGSYDVSTNHGSGWSQSSIAGFGTFFDCIFYNDKFIVMSTTGTTWTSTDGSTWSSATPITVTHPGKNAFLPYGYTYRSLVKCGGVLFCLFKGVFEFASNGMVCVFYSYDGATWHDSGAFFGTHSSVIETAASRFSIHLASSAMNAASSIDNSIQQIVGRVIGVQHFDWDVDNSWIISPSVAVSKLY